MVWLLGWTIARAACDEPADRAEVEALLAEVESLPNGPPAHEAATRLRQRLGCLREPVLAPDVPRIFRVLARHLPRGGRYRKSARALERGRGGHGVTVDPRWVIDGQPLALWLTRGWHLVQERAGPTSAMETTWVLGRALPTGATARTAMDIWPAEDGTNVVGWRLRRSWLRHPRL